MTALELIRALAHDAAVGIVITDAMIDLPGPAILYVNDAFGRLVGQPPGNLIGLSPRFMQGKQTLRSQLDTYHNALTAGVRFHGYLTNYRGDGTMYRAEIDCRPLRAADGRVENFVSFEREVVRRLGRPMTGADGRYVPASVGDDQIADALRSLGVFKHLWNGLQI
ncbi:PAS domain-containing protein [Methylobacterium pseudosasicola]|uniref:PAS domain S-box-containing protein n=1 Tax=Methylobacterium pseudosasicola TaxID=582667 RepID=A0A1I4VQ55_9HYPH|nr:PAS domain-containing protein [Methylobacterium pseudosasicola]SFN03086.1 PAS domain S-box-containing protein [Methylobacterium pseudosasicola]